MWYITCTGGLQGLELVSICRNLPEAVLARGPVRHALKTYSALTRGDVGLFLKLHQQAAWRQQTLTKVKLQQASDALLCLHDISSPPSVQLHGLHGDPSANMNVMQHVLLVLTISMLNYVHTVWQSLTHALVSHKCGMTAGTGTRFGNLSGILQAAAKR